MGGFWNDNDSMLNIPAQNDLRCCLFVLLSNLDEYRVFKQASSPLSKRCPGLHLNSIFIYSLLCYRLLVEGMGFYLVDHRLHTAKGGYIYQSVRIKI